MTCAIICSTGVYTKPGGHTHVMARQEIKYLMEQIESAVTQVRNSDEGSQSKS